MPEDGRMARQGPLPATHPQAQIDNRTRIQQRLVCNVLLLNGEEFQVLVDKQSVGQVLFENVCDYLDLLERDYFGLLYIDEPNPENAKHWLDLNKKITKQKKSGRMNFEFAVKFYPPDPTQLAEIITRYLLCLQIRRDIISGKLLCSQVTQVLLGSYAVQADIGDYDPVDHGPGIEYIRDMTFVRDQTEDLLYKIAALHKQHKGQTPEQAELHYLENSKKIPLYGTDLHKAKDSDYVDIMIGVGATGISIFRDHLRINRFIWPKVLQISYRKNKFLLRLRPAEFETYESWIAFRLQNNKMAKRLWKVAVENHAFLRLRSAEDAKKRTGFPRFGSKHRFSGRTLFQTRLNASMADRHPKKFERTHSQHSLNSVLNSRSKSHDNLSHHQQLHRGQTMADLHNLSLEVSQPARNKTANIEVDRTPLQSPLHQQAPLHQQVPFHQQAQLHQRVPPHQQDSSKLTSHETARTKVRQSSNRQERDSDSDRSSEASMTSADLMKKERRRTKRTKSERSSKSDKHRTREKPPVAEKPLNYKKPPTTEKPQKVEKPPVAPKPTKKNRDAAMEVFM